MRIIFKTIAAPFVLVLTLTVAILTFILFLSGWAFNLVSFIIGVGGAGLLFTGNTTGGIGCLVIAFLVSPFGLPAVAEWLIDRMADLNFALRDFITS